MDISYKEFKNAKSVMNILEKCFPPDPGDYKYIEKHAWVIAIYTMVRELKIGHSLTGKENIIREFIESFHGKVYNESFRSSKVNYQRFYDNVRGGWSEKIISLRWDILIKEFLEKNPLPELDDKRQLTDQEKITANSLNPFCAKCNRKFKDYKEPEYHHINRYIDGGETEQNNILVVCKECHDKIHGIIKIPDIEEKDLPGDDE